MSLLFLCITKLLAAQAVQATNVKNILLKFFFCNFLKNIYKSFILNSRPPLQRRQQQTSELWESSNSMTNECEKSSNQSSIDTSIYYKCLHEYSLTVVLSKHGFSIHFSSPALPVALIFLVLHQTEPKSHDVVV